MELDWLETFLAVVDNGGFTTAALQVHRSQSRVSAHIASLERELGVQLIDRRHRPATLTPAGRLFADYARRILAELSSARNAVGVLRAIDEDRLTVLTTPYLGTVLFPQVLAEIMAGHPGARVLLSEQGCRDSDSGDSRGDFAMAVLPTAAAPTALELNQRVLWREPLQVVVPRHHELAADGAPVSLHKLVQHPLVLPGGGGRAGAEIPVLLASRGLEITARTDVDATQTLVELARRGIGVGIESAVALSAADTTGLVVLAIDDPSMVREVALYWHEVLLTSSVGQMLHREVIRAPLPAGAQPC